MLVYDRERAVAYAHRWAFSRNPAFLNFDTLGGDCTNFASQVLYAGSGVMNYTPVFGWYYRTANDRTPSWTGVQYLYNFLTTNKTRGPFAEETDIKDIKPGDLIQLSFRDNIFSHTPIVVETGVFPSLDNILVAAHTYDLDYKPIKAYSFEKFRCLHIIGVLV